MSTENAWWGVGSLNYQRVNGKTSLSKAALVPDVLQSKQLLRWLKGNPPTQICIQPKRHRITAHFNLRCATPPHPQAIFPLRIKPMFRILIRGVFDLKPPRKFTRDCQGSDRVSGCPRNSRALRLQILCKSHHAGVFVRKTHAQVDGFLQTSRVEGDSDLLFSAVTSSKSGCCTCTRDAIAEIMLALCAASRILRGITNKRGLVRKKSRQQ